MADQIAPSGSYFCVSGVAEYASTSAQYPSLARVPDEISAVRRALSGLGLTELFRAPTGENTHDQLREAFKGSANSAQAAWTEIRPADRATLVIYCTGHGYYRDTDNEWRLVPPDCEPYDSKRYMTPAELLEPLMSAPGIPALGQIVLILDSCFAGSASSATLQKSLGSATAAGNEFDLRIIASARRLDEAQEYLFAPAFEAAVADVAEPSWDRQYLDIASLTERIQGQIGADAAGAAAGGQPSQSVWVVEGHGGECRALPNPRHMPTELPGWLDPQWDATARGVHARGDPGWFFTGRRDVLQQVTDHLAGHRPSSASSLIITGGRGSGKTAVLARLLCAATAPGGAPRLARLPGTHSLPPLAAARVMDGMIQEPAVLVRQLCRRLGTQLGMPADSPAELSASLSRARRPAAVILDQIDDARDPGAILEQIVFPLMRLPHVRLALGVRPALAAQLPASMARIDLDRADPPTSYEIRDYLRGRLALLGRPGAPDEEQVRTLAALAMGCFAAAEEAARALESAVRGGNRSPAGEAQEAIARTLRGVVHSTMAGVLHSQARAEALELALVALCSLHPDASLPLDVWSGVASRLVGSPVTPAEAQAAAEASVPFLEALHAPGSRLAWRPQYRYVHDPAGRSQPGVVNALLNYVNESPDFRWADIDPGLARIIAAASGVSAAVHRLLDRPEFLLDAPGFVTTQALKSLPDPLERARRARMWRCVPTAGTYYQRALALRMAALRFGFPELARASAAATAGPGTAVWVQPDADAHARAPVTALTLVSSSTMPVAIAIHDDGTLSAWAVENGAATIAWPWPLTMLVKRMSAIQSAGTLMVAITDQAGRLQLCRISSAGSAEPLPMGRRAPLIHGSHQSFMDCTKLGSLLLPRPSGYPYGYSKRVRSCSRRHFPGVIWLDAR